MVLVTNYLCKLITKQIDDNGIVVWYDPDRHYTEIVHTLSIHNTTVTCYSDTFFGLRHKIDHLLDDLNPPRLLIYVPIHPIETNNALVELEAAGVIMKPGQQPPSRNTKLSVVARNALKPILGDDTATAPNSQRRNFSCC